MTVPLTSQTQPPAPSAATTSTPVTARADRYVCATCHIDMGVADMNDHLMGKRHAKNLGKKAAGKRPGKNAAGSNSKKGRKPPPSPGYSPYSDDFTHEDGLALLRDIDTQWGLLPGGGAYKESNHYFGPGIHDYY
ncbi:hypothetical protein FPV67DRAFT_1190770 [Lyophyllum atratum]|nr:hypothetical protein FPV67DRAFT_1190770 [Lyophyllum atratum]